MYYGLVYFPVLNSASARRFRRRYDPCQVLIEAHLPLIFPVPASIGKGRLVQQFYLKTD